MTSIFHFFNWQLITPRFTSGGPGSVSSEPPASYRFMGVGASTLNQFKSGAANSACPPAALPDMVGNKFTLSVITSSGVQVELVLASQDEGMAGQLSVSGEVSEAERGALSALAEGFQSAIDGMMKDKLQVRLAALVQFDSALLESVELHAAVKLDNQPPSTLTLDFHADSAQKKVRITGASGKVAVKVNTSKLESLGSKEQQTKAISRYLKQFDQAAMRGHADADLMSMFKDAFSDMNRTSHKVAPADTGLTLPGKRALAEEDHAVLTGLGDFSASVEQTPKFSNPLRLAEKNSFTYEISQCTSIEEARPLCVVEVGVK